MPPAARTARLLLARLRVVASVLVGVLLALPAAVGAQGAADVVRGRVIDDSARAVVGAAIHVTRGPDRAVQQTTTDSGGRYSVRFDPGTGDYLVAVSYAGFRPARRRVQRQQSERELVADFTLGRDLSVLAAVKVQAQRPARASNDVRPTTLEAGSSEKWADGVEGQLSPTMAGDLTALLGTMPGVTLTPGGPSVLGAGAESNLTTLNGMAFAGGGVPRAARTETRFTGATYDPTRGGFAGGNTDVRLAPGSRNYQRRNAFFTLDARELQFTDEVGRSSGARNGGFRGSVGADGELIRRALTYNVAVDVARSASDPATLLAADEATLLRAGVSPDSVARLVGVATPLGLPLSGLGAPAARQRDAVTWLGRFDDTRDTLHLRTLTTSFGLTNQGALGFGPLAAPSAGGEMRQRFGTAQLTSRDFVGPGSRVLTETRFAANWTGTTVDPYRAIPGASVLVRSNALDARSDVTSLSVGGNPYIANDDRAWIAEGANETSWNARGTRHRFKSLVWGRADGIRQEAGGNLLGSYAFNSIADFQAGRAASYTRTLVQPVRSGTAWNAAAALAHQYVPSRYFNLMYGARVEAGGFGDAPPRNPALESALGVRTGVAPTRVHVSPRIGFNWTYSKSKENGTGTNQNPVGRFYRYAAGTVRGGIGEFRDLLKPGLVADASAATGLPGATEVLSCVGAAVPAPDWTRFLQDATTIPTRCADGAGVLAERASSVTLIDPGYDAKRSWRASLDWNASVAKMMVKVGGLASYDLAQPGVVDANFSGQSRFALDGEGGRPVYVSPAAIDPASGAVSAAESRRSSAFGRVGVRTSDLRGYGGQLNFTVSPDVFKARLPKSLYTSLTYTLQGMRRQYRGFDGAGFGDPRMREWAADPNDARHVVLLQGGMWVPKVGSVTLFARAQSGLPFTPTVQGDPNGDGRFGDRAFVPSEASATAAGDAALAAQLRALVATGTPAARECLTAYAGQVAARNGCRGPWTQTLNMQIRPQLPRKLARRWTSTIYLDNVLGGVDQLVHGASDLRGWGSTATPDGTLLVPRGFDAAARGGPRFRYDVNPRFGDARGARTLTRTPFRLTIDFSLNFAVDYDVQQLRRALEPVKVAKGRWERRSADSLAAFYMQNTSNVHAALLAESDSLFLTREQVAALRRTDSVYSARVRALYVPLGQFLAQFSDGVAGKAALDSVTATQKLYWKVFWEQPELADSALTPLQRDLFPMIKNMVAVPKKQRENSQWQFGFPVKLLPPEKPRAVTASP
jgi:hypothetical protein